MRSRRLERRRGQSSAASEPAEDGDYPREPKAPNGGPDVAGDPAAKQAVLQVQVPPAVPARRLLRAAYDRAPRLGLGILLGIGLWVILILVGFLLAKL